MCDMSLRCGGTIRMVRVRCERGVWLGHGVVIRGKSGCILREVYLLLVVVRDNGDNELYPISLTHSPDLLYQPLSFHDDLETLGTGRITC